MRQCGAGERWAGLWDFPRFRLDAEGPLLASEEIVTKLLGQTGVTCTSPKLLTAMKHGVTRFRISLACYQAQYVAGRARAPHGATIRWVPLDQLPALPLSTTGRKMAKLVSK
jgi:A/G-specific adenine glycosylase